MWKYPSEYHIEKKFRRFTMLNRGYDTPAWQAIIADPEQLFRLPKIHYFKNKPNDTSTVALVTVNQIPVVIKRYNIKYFVHRVKLWLRKSRGMTSWLNIERLRTIQVPTVEPIALIEERFGWLRGKAYFIYRYVEGPASCNYFPQHKPLTTAAKKVLENMAHNLHKMRLAKLSHGDMHHNNLAVLNEEILLLDLDHMQQHRFHSNAFKKAHQKDIDKFIYYLEDHEEAKQYFREVHAKIAGEYKHK